MRHSSSLLKARFHHLVVWMSLWAALCLRSQAAPSAAPNYFIHLWQTDQGLPRNSVTAVVQTHDGYLWVGTYGGLARFDGVRFTIYNNNNTPQMFSSRVTSLYEDSAGTLWIGTETGGVVRYLDGIFQGQESLNWNIGRIVSIGESRSGEIWVLGARGVLLRVRDGFMISTGGGGDAELGAIVQDQQGRVWVLANSKLFQLDGDKLTPAPFIAQSTNAIVQGLCASRDGGVWVAIQNRVRKWQENGWTTDLGSTPWGPGAATVLLERRSGDLAAGVVENGLDLLMTDGRVLNFGRSNGMPSDWVRSMCEDREGSLWIGTGNGLAVLRLGKVDVLNPPDMWQGRAALSVSADPDGALWVGTEGAGLYRLLEGQWTQSSVAEGIANPFVWSVAPDARGRVWVGTWGGGLLVQSGERFVRAPGFEDNTIAVLALLHASDGSTWVGTQSGLAHDENGKVEWFGRNKGLIYPDVRAVVQDSKGAVWFGMLGGGLGLLKDGAVRQFRKVNGLSSDFVHCLRLDRDGSLWIGTFGGGLVRLKGGRFSAVSTANGLPSDVICDIQDDEHGNFWCSSYSGIFRVSKKYLHLCADHLTNSVHCLTFGRSDGLPTLECSGGFQPSGCRTADGRLWFPTSKGVVVVDPTERNINHLPPPVIVEGVYVDGKSLAARRENGGELKTSIPPGSGRIEFRYTGLSLAAPEKVKFKYKLEGLDRDWIDGGTDRSVVYPFIPPGKYTFHVTACNNDGIWNDNGETLAVTMLPHYWQTWWFRVLGGLAVIGMIFSIVWYDARRRLTRKLERLEREQAIERERSRIAKDIHDDLGASLTRITLLSQSARGDLDNAAEAAANLDRIYTTAREVTRSMDEIVWAVNPQHDSLDSLASYLGRYAQEFLGSAGVRCRLDFSVQLPGWPLSAEVRHNLFLSFKEALHNVVKHASATEVRVTLTLRGSVFSLAIEDNGRGFDVDGSGTELRADADRVAHGHGLANVRRRLAEIGGRCEIRSAPGRGTSIRFIMPVVVTAAEGN